MASIKKGEPAVHQLFLFSFAAAVSLAHAHQGRPSDCENNYKTGVATPKQTQILSQHGHVRADDFYWLRERGSEAVLAHLERENRHTDEALSDTVQMQEELLNEMVDRMPLVRESAPVKKGEYTYFRRFRRDLDYGETVRVHRGREQVILDENQLAEGQSYMDVPLTTVSPDHKWMAYTVDWDGMRQHKLYIKNLETGEVLDTGIGRLNGAIAWANDNRTLFMLQNDPVTLRPYKLLRWSAGREPEVVYEESDPQFTLSLSRSRAGNFLFLTAYKRNTTEVRYLPASQPEGEWTVFAAREDNIEYGLEDGGDRFYISTDWQNPNYRVMEAPLRPTAKEQWREVFAADENATLEGLQANRDFLVITEREGGLTHLRVLDRRTGKSRRLEMPDPLYHPSVADAGDFNTSKVRFRYTSLNRPPVVFEEDVTTGQREVVTRLEFPGYNPDNFESRRLWATAADGTKIPVSIYMKKGTRLNGKSPLLLRGYGAYGNSEEVEFSPTLVSLVERGFIVAIAHVRGGSEMGREWYEQGRLKNKMNSFTDFIASAEHLIREGYSTPKHMYAEGHSAGGLLMGAVINMRPDLFNGVIAGVPFVDVVTTMLDDTLPLTTGEYREWGDPRNREDYFRMLSYSPYDNVKKQDYPNLLVTGGYNDSQVPYWEPAKWVAKLREHKTDDNLLLLRTFLEAGHSGSSGLSGQFKDEAFLYAFLLKLEYGTAGF